MNSLLKDAIAFVRYSLDGPWNFKKMVLILTIFTLPMGPLALIIYFGVRTFGERN